ncbi:MAG: TauD/TfdA family dioxygenase [Oligoflexales bacterium]|nr:TauD/TfdA family dioxygenase [Oligoflexales bacterium]
MTDSANALVAKGSQVWLKTDEGQQIELHPLWLRERASSENCLDPQNFQRLYDPNTIPSSLTVTEASISDHKTLTVKFSDGCLSRFSIKDILYEHKGSLSAPNSGVEPTCWNTSLSELPKQDYPDKTSKSDLSWLKLLEALKKFGFVIVENAPRTPQATVEFAESIGPIKTTNFGKIFDVLEKPNSEKEDLAYTNQALSPHTDNPYRFPAPGTQILHALENECEGGLSTLVDGFAVAKKLQQEHPDDYEILCKTKVRFIFVSKDSILENRFPLIKANQKGEPERIHFSSRVDYAPLLSKGQLDRFYKARSLFFELLNSEEYNLRFKLESGSILVMNNHRVLHGRTAYKPHASKVRHLRGCYIDNDDIDGRLRVLTMKLLQKNASLLYPGSN